MPNGSSKPCTLMSDMLTSERRWQDFSFSSGVDLPNRESTVLITKSNGHVFSHKKSGEGKHCLFERSGGCARCFWCSANRLEFGQCDGQSAQIQNTKT